MKIVAAPDTSAYYAYWRCANKGDNEYTNVIFTGKQEHEEFLQKTFDEAVLRTQRLPGWRLYAIVDD